jgi:hypothetical protein
MRVRRLRHRLFLQVVRDDHARYRSLDERDADGAIDEMPDLAGQHRGLHELRGDILEERLQIDFLLIRAAHGQPRRLPDDGDDRLVIELRVVQPVQQMDRAGAGRGQTDAHVSGELRMRAGHDRGHLFVAHLHEVHVAVRALERAHDSVDAVAGISVDAVNAPFIEALDEKVGDGLVCHPGYSAANAIVDSSAFSAWRESRRVCWTTIGTSEVMTLE